MSYVDYRTVRWKQLPQIPRTIVLSKVVVVVTVIYLTIVKSVKSIPYYIYICEHC